MKMHRILSLGAGVQSTALLLMSIRGELPRIDHAIFADTQAEPPAVYKHLEWLESECNKAGIPLHKITVGDLRADAIQFRSESRASRADGSPKRYASIPLFVLNPDKSVGRIRRQCTSEYKINPIESFIKRELLGIAPGKRMPKTHLVEQWLGISSDELRRAKTPSKSKKDGKPQPIWWKTHVFPLVSIEKWWGLSDGGLFGFPVPIPHQRIWQPREMAVPLNMSRADVIAWLKREYPDRECPRSACIECPYRRNEEWLAIKNDDPASFELACVSDEKFREADLAGQKARGMIVGLPFIHRTCQPLREVDLTKADNWSPVPEVDEDGETIFSQSAESECEGMCGV